MKSYIVFDYMSIRSIMKVNQNSEMQIEISEEGIARIKIVHNNISGEYYIHKLN